MGKRKKAARARRLAGRRDEELRDRIRAALARGLTRQEVVAEVGCGIMTVARVVREDGGVGLNRKRARQRSAKQLSLAEREEISRGLTAGSSCSEIARSLGRSPSTITREVKKNGGRDAYRAWVADRRADDNAARPKTPKLAGDGPLRRYVVAGLGQDWSPEQISHRIREDHPDDPEMRVCAETIYQSLYVQARGALERELTKHLRTKRVWRKNRKRTSKPSGVGKIPDMVMISDRPSEVEDRAVPGHWEGDLIICDSGLSATATLVERTTRFLMIIGLPEGRKTADAVREALAAHASRLPEMLIRSITWDQGSEMSQHSRFTVETNIPVYFCDPHHPWQRGTNENTNGLIRQYMPKNFNLAGVAQDELDGYARLLNGRPRKILSWATPAEEFEKLLAQAA